jgi:hypothetical protein
MPPSRPCERDGTTASAVERLCDELIHKKSGVRPIVVSDETLTETPQLYFAPYTMPRDAIALRLHRLFPSAKIIFTIRDQRYYAESMYLNLKRNAAYFDRMPIAPFSDWLAGVFAVLRANYLQNLNFFDCISLYAEIFTRENICVMPLEMAVAEGVRAYLGRLCAFMGLELAEADLAHYVPIHNRRMSVYEELVAELVEDERFSRLHSDLSNALGPERLAALLEGGPRSAADMRPADEAKIRRRVDTGNWLLAREFGLDLERYGYPLIKGHDLAKRQLSASEQQSAFERDTARRRTMPRSEAVLDVRRAAEMAALRSQLNEMASELDRVSGSPVWRAVKHIEGVRHILMRAAAMAFALLGWVWERKQEVVRLLWQFPSLFRRYGMR